MRQSPNNQTQDTDEKAKLQHFGVNTKFGLLLVTPLGVSLASEGVFISPTLALVD